MGVAFGIWGPGARVNARLWCKVSTEKLWPVLCPLLLKTGNGGTANRES